MVLGERIAPAPLDIGHGEVILVAHAIAAITRQKFIFCPDGAIFDPPCLMSFNGLAPGRALVFSTALTRSPRNTFAQLSPSVRCFTLGSALPPGPNQRRAWVPVRPTTTSNIASNTGARSPGEESALLDQKRSFPNRGRSADLYDLPLTSYGSSSVRGNEADRRVKQCELSISENYRCRSPGTPTRRCRRVG